MNRWQKAFHRLWTLAAGHPGYDKGVWKIAREAIDEHARIHGQIGLGEDTALTSAPGRVPEPGDWFHGKDRRGGRVAWVVLKADPEARTAYVVRFSPDPGVALTDGPQSWNAHRGTWIPWRDLATMTRE